MKPFLRKLQQGLGAGWPAGIAAGLLLILPATASAQSPWTLIWSDEFNGAANTRVNATNWLYDLGTGYGCSGCPGNWGTGEVETTTNSTANVALDGAGHLRITPIRDASGRWTSGRIETQRTDFRPPPGGALAVEASLQQPNVSGAAAAGYWPAFWMLGAPFRGNFLNWPSIGEIDIMEDVNGRSTVFAALHCGVNPGGPCNETVGRSSGERACAGCKTGLHTFRMELDMGITPNQMRWFLDGNLYFTINSNEVDATTWRNATDHGFFILLDLAIGGGFPAAFGGGPTASTASGVPMIVDYVRVFTRTGGGTPPPPPPPPPISGVHTISPNTNLNKRVDVRGASTANGTPVQVWDANGTGAQNWNFSSAGVVPAGNFNLAALGPFCLNVSGGSAAAGTRVQLWACNGSAAQSWNVVALGNGLFNFKSAVGSNLCLDDPAGNTNNGTQFIIWPCNGGNNQRFRIN